MLIHLTHGYHLICFATTDAPLPLPRRHFKKTLAFNQAQLQPHQRPQIELFLINHLFFSMSFFQHKLHLGCPFDVHLRNESAKNGRHIATFQFLAKHSNTLRQSLKDKGTITANCLDKVIPLREI
jgi:hypothetical protein